VEAARVEVRLGNIRQTKRGAAADLAISEAGIAGEVQRVSERERD
jgi:hypothetical protein